MVESSNVRKQDHAVVKAGEVTVVQETHLTEEIFEMIVGLGMIDEEVDVMISEAGMTSVGMTETSVGMIEISAGMTGTSVDVVVVVEKEDTRVSMGVWMDKPSSTMDNQGQHL